MARLPAALAACLAWLALAGPAHAAELVMFESARCAWCLKWHREIGPIYPKTDEGRLLPLRSVEVPGTLPQDLRRLKPPVKYTPTFVAFACGREIGRIQGYASEEQFWGEVAEMATRAKKTSC